MSARKFRDSWWVDFRWKHTRYRKRSPVNTRAGALEYETTLRGRLARGEPLEPTKHVQKLFDVFSREWMENYATANNRPSTLLAKRYILDKYLVPTFGHLPLAEISSSRIEQYKSARLEEGLMGKTVNNHLAVLHAALKTAEDWGDLTAAPRVRLLKVPPSQITFLVNDECARLLEAARKPGLDEIILCGLRTGMRFGELTALDWGDVDLSRRLVTVRRSVVRGIMGVPKNNRIRYIPIASDLEAVLAARVRPSGLVFPGTAGKPRPWPTAIKALQRTCITAGIRSIGWHVLRHTFASQLVARGVPIRAVQVLLGHSTVQMTERYAHLAPSSLQEAIQALVLPPNESLGNCWATPVENGELGAGRRDQFSAQLSKCRLSH